MIDLLFASSFKTTIGLVEFDTSLSERHTSESEATEHPMEEGSSVTDHIIIKGDTFEMNGLITDTPIIYLAALNATSPVKSGGISYSSMARSIEGYEYLKQQQKDRALLDVLTSLVRYENMYLASINVLRDQNNGKVLNCNLVMKEVLKSYTTTIEIPIPALAEITKGVKDKGQPGKIESTPKQAAEVESAGYKGGAALGFW